MSSTQLHISCQLSSRIYSTKKGIKYISYISCRRLNKNVMRNTQFWYLKVCAFLPSFSIYPHPPTVERPPISMQPTVSTPASNLVNQSSYLTLDLARQQFNLDVDKPQSATDSMKCYKCEKIFESSDDMKWH